MPSQARANQLREIEAHLRAIAEARGNGSIAEALVQFGKLCRVGRDLLRAWEREAWERKAWERKAWERKAWERKQSEPLWRVILATSSTCGT